LAPSKTQLGYDFAMARSLPPTAGNYTRGLFIDGCSLMVKNAN